MLDLSNNKLSGGIPSNLLNMKGFIDNITSMVLATNDVTQVSYLVSRRLSLLTVELAMSFQGQVCTITENGLVWTITLSLAAIGSQALFLKIF